MIPSIGRIVHYRLTEQDAERITAQRDPETGESNKAEAGQVYPMLIVRTWGEAEGSAVNGQVFLDGPDTLWVTSRKEGEHNGGWFQPPRV